VLAWSCLGGAIVRVGLLSLFAPALCAACEGSMRTGDGLCERCRREVTWLPAEPVEVAGVEAWAPVAYLGPARALVGALKFRGATAVADSMAAMVAAGAPAPLLEGATLVPVPPHPARLRARGYDQAELLASALARRTGLPLLRALVRTGEPVSQVGRGRGARFRSIAGSFVALRSVTAPRRPLLVDDVITTGATLAACARALEAAAPRAVAFARTPGR
jgi:predicted amidophosphoribosyltransferase